MVTDDRSHVFRPGLKEIRRQAVCCPGAVSEEFPAIGWVRRAALELVQTSGEPLIGGQLHFLVIDLERDLRLAHFVVVIHLAGKAGEKHPPRVIRQFETWNSPSFLNPRAPKTFEGTARSELHIGPSQSGGASSPLDPLERLLAAKGV